MVIRQFIACSRFHFCNEDENFREKIHHWKAWVHERNDLAMVSDGHDFWIISSSFLVLSLSIMIVDNHKQHYWKLSTHVWSASPNWSYRFMWFDSRWYRIVRRANFSISSWLLAGLPWLLILPFTFFVLCCLKDQKSGLFDDQRNQEMK